MVLFVLSLLWLAATVVSAIIGYQVLKKAYTDAAIDSTDPSDCKNLGNCHNYCLLIAGVRVGQADSGVGVEDIFNQLSKEERKCKAECDSKYPNQHKSVVKGLCKL